MGAHRLSLIIPTQGRPHDLAACLRSIEEGAGPELAQVIVIDDAPKAPAEVPQRLANAEVRVHRNREPIGAAASRNKALAMLCPDVNAVGFLDDDVRLPREWFSVALAELTPARGAITGPIQAFDTGLVARARQLRYDARYRPLRAHQAVDFLAGGNTVAWRSTLERAGNFPEAATMSDTLLARRLHELGMPCHFVPELLALHRNSKGGSQACVAAWQAGVVEGPRRATTYGQRLANGTRGVLDSPDPTAAALNVAFDAVFLTAHAMSRISSLSGQRVRSLPRVAQSVTE
jgi:GT2 family glycosyltransferase